MRTSPWSVANAVRGSAVVEVASIGVVVSCFVRCEYGKSGSVRGLLSLCLNLYRVHYREKRRIIFFWWQ